MRTTVYGSRAELNFRAETAVIMRGIVRGILKTTLQNFGQQHEYRVSHVFRFCCGKSALLNGVRSGGSQLARTR
jgi:hypothetical protein